MSYGKKSRIWGYQISRKRSRKRFVYQFKTVKCLQEKGPMEYKKLKKELKVPSREERTFQRGVEDLETLQVIKNVNGKLVLLGQEPPEEIHVTVGTGNLEFNIPLKREQAKKVIQKIPSIKKEATTRKVLEEVDLV